MGAVKSGRVLAGIVIGGLFATPFLGQIALEISFLIAGLLMMFWVARDCLSEVRVSWRRKKKVEILFIAAEYSILLSGIGVAILFLIKFIWF